MIEQESMKLLKEGGRACSQRNKELGVKKVLGGGEKVKGAEGGGGALRKERLLGK